METRTEETLEQLTRKVAKGGIIVFTGSIFGRGIEFVLHMLLARVLGASSYGLYALGYSVVMIKKGLKIIVW